MGPWRSRPTAATGWGGLVLVLILAVSCSDDDSGPLAPVVVPGYTYPVAAYREAGRITGVGATAALRGAHSGDTEGSVKEIIAEAFLSEGSATPAFESIVAAGGNALTLHYAGNDSTLRVGDLALIDIGATSDGICSDCSRTFPADTAFTPRQRELYQLVLDVHEGLAVSVRPGVDSVITLTRRAKSLFAASPLRARDDDGEIRTMDVFLIHGVAHYVGKQVHGEDTGWGQREPLEVGQVITIEPGLYVGSEATGIRIEDTYLVTDSGLECLTCGCPKEPEEVEAMRRASTAP